MGRGWKTYKSTMQIRTVSITLSHYKKMSLLVGGIHPSMAELVRSAVNKFCKKEIDLILNNTTEENSFIKKPKSDPIIEMSVNEEEGFIIKTKVLGTKEEWFKSIKLNKNMEDKIIYLNNTIYNKHYNNPRPEELDFI